MPPFTQQVTFLYTPDLAATAWFYEQILGLELVLDQGVCRIYRVSRDGFIGFCQKEGVEPRPQTVIITFVTPEVEAWYTRLSAQGVPFENPPTFNPQYNIFHCFLRDPNGYLLEIQRFLDPTWPTGGN